MINQLRFTYTRQFGGRVNNPTTSLGDLNSNVQDPGRPDAAASDASPDSSPVRPSIAGPDAGSDYFAVKDSLSISRGNHSFKVGGEISYEKIVHDTLLDNYGVFAFNGSKTGNAYADFLLGLPSTMTQDAPIRKLDNGGYYSFFAQDDFRVHPRVTLNLGRPLRPAAAATPIRRTASWRSCPGMKSTVSPNAPEGLLFPGRSGHQPRHRRRPTRTTSRRAWASRGIRRGDGRMSVRAARRHLLRQHHRQRVEHHGRQSAVHRPPVVPDGEDAFRSLRQPARRRRPVPVRLRSGKPALHLSGAGVRSIARLRVAEDLSDERHRREAAVPQLQHERLVRRRARTQPAGEHRSQLSRCSARARPPPTSTRAGRISRASSAPRACSNRSSPATTTACSSAPRSAAAASRRRPTIRSARRSRISTTRAAGFRRCRTRTSSICERARTSADRTHTLRVLRHLAAWITSTTSRPVAAQRSLNDWTVSAIVTLQSGTPLTITAGQDRNFDGNTNDRADLIGDPKLDSGRPREELIEHWFNTAAFALPADRRRRQRAAQRRRRPGLSQRRPRRVPRHPAGGRTSLQLRVEATNVFNIVNLMNPGTNLNAPATFAKIRAARDMRRIQLGARLSF